MADDHDQPGKRGNGNGPLYRWADAGEMLAGSSESFVTRFSCAGELLLTLRFTSWI